MLVGYRPCNPIRDGAELGEYRPVVPQQRRDLAFRVHILERLLLGLAAGDVELFGLIRKPAFLEQDVRTDRTGMRTPEQLHVYLPKICSGGAVVPTRQQPPAAEFDPASALC